MSDYRKTIHIQIDGHDVSADIGQEKDGSADEVIRALLGLAGFFDAEKADKADKADKEEEQKEECKKPCQDEEKEAAAQEQDDAESDSSDDIMNEDISASDVLRALQFLVDVLDKTDDSDDEVESDAEQDEEKDLTQDQKNVLVGFDVACDSILMFLAGLDMYRDQIRNALLSYGFDAKDSVSANVMIDKLFEHNALSELATGCSEDEAKGYGSAFRVYKVLRDAMLESLGNSRKHIVASFVEQNNDSSGEEG